MKPSNLTLLAALAVGGMLIALPASAQNTPTNTPAANPAISAHPRPMRGPNIDRLAQILNLTEAEKPKFQSALDEQWTKIREVITNNSFSREEKMQKIQAIREGTTAQMKGILTPDQFEKFQRMMPHPHLMMRRPTATNAPPQSAP
jgi:Spy/CpxP family protein refolding chaperone